MRFSIHQVTEIRYSLIFVSISKGLSANRQGQESFTLDLSRHHEHRAFEAVNMSLNVLRHNCRPVLVVTFVGEQRYQ